MIIVIVILRVRRIVKERENDDKQISFHCFFVVKSKLYIIIKYIALLFILKKWGLYTSGFGLHINTNQIQIHSLMLA